VQDSPAPTLTTIQQDQVEAAAEGEVVSRREALRRVQVDHPSSLIISNINERTTRSRSRNLSHFAHSASIANLSRKTLDTPSLILIG
jgi:hypothetical protein